MRFNVRNLFGERVAGLLVIQKLGCNRETPRLWIESQRLDALGFSHGVPLQIEGSRENLVLRPAVLGQNHVSSREVCGGRRPIIDLESHSLLSGLAEYSEVKIIASFERIQVTPSHGAFAIQKSRSLMPPFRVLEVFAGGGTMTAALAGDSRFQVTAGVEIEPAFADEWQAKHPGALLIQSDIRSLHTLEIPACDILMSLAAPAAPARAASPKRVVRGRSHAPKTSPFLWLVDCAIINPS